MNKSDWIALAACIIAFIGLIPQYFQVFSKRKKKKKNITVATTNEIMTKPIEIPIPNDTMIDSSEREPQPPMIRILVFLVTAIIIGLIELIIFSAIAHYCGVKVDLNTMSLLWKIVFYSLFIIPGILFVYAFLVFTAMFDD